MNIWFIMGLVGFLILWEILYLIQRKLPSFGVGGFMLEPASWIEYKMAAFMNIILIIFIFGSISIIGWMLYIMGIIVEAIVTIFTVAIFFGINYIFKDKKFRRKRK